MVVVAVADIGRVAGVAHRPSRYKYLCLSPSYNNRCVCDVRQGLLKGACFCCLKEGVLLTGRGVTFEAVVINSNLQAVTSHVLEVV